MSSACDIRPEHAIAETESSIASTPMTTPGTILTVLDTYVLRCFSRAGGSAGLLLAQSVGAAPEFFFLFAIVGLSHNESDKRHCVTTQPPRHAGALGTG